MSATVRYQTYLGIAYGTYCLGVCRCSVGNRFSPDARTASFYQYSGSLQAFLEGTYMHEAEKVPPQNNIYIYVRYIYETRHQGRPRRP